MNTNKRTNCIDKVMNEYIEWGGPVVQRKVAYADMKARGFDNFAIDCSVFGRNAVETPENPEAHLAFHYQIVAMEAARA